jgi:holo-[acyl-carrier protein] synthase
MSVIGVGVDIERVDRFLPYEKVGRLIERLFTPLEINYCNTQAVPARSFAARFAAKEATVKALNDILPGLLVTQIEVFKEKNSPVPRIRLKEGAVIPEGVVLHVSLSHTDEYGTAFVVAEKEELHP